MTTVAGQRVPIEIDVQQCGGELFRAVACCQECRGLRPSRCPCVAQRHRVRRGSAQVQHRFSTGSAQVQHRVAQGQHRGGVGSAWGQHGVSMGSAWVQLRASTGSVCTYLRTPRGQLADHDARGRLLRRRTRALSHRPLQAQGTCTAGPRRCMTHSPGLQTPIINGMGVKVFNSGFETCLHPLLRRFWAPLMKKN